MKFSLPKLLLGALLATSVGAFAQSAASRANEQRCQNLSQEVQASYQQAVLARVPKEDPSTFNQESFDIKGLMSQDVSSSFSKLMNLDFGSIIDKVVNKAMGSAMQRGSQTFNSKINGVLQQAGVQKGVQMQTYSGAGGLNLQSGYSAPQGSWATGGAQTTARPTTPYGRRP